MIGFIGSILTNSSGMFTVMVAAMHRKVVAVDPILNNLAMIHHSLKTVNNEDYVTLMNNPVR